MHSLAPSSVKDVAEPSPLRRERIASAAVFLVLLALPARHVNPGASGVLLSGAVGLACLSSAGRLANGTTGDVRILSLGGLTAASALLANGPTFQVLLPVAGTALALTVARASGSIQKILGPGLFVATLASVVSIRTDDRLGLPVNLAAPLFGIALLLMTSDRPITQRLALRCAGTAVIFVATASRATLFSLAISILIAEALGLSRNWRAAAGFLALGALALIVLAPSPGSLSGRSELWQLSWGIGSAHWPHGIGDTELDAALVENSALASRIDSGRSHSIYLDAFAARGLVGAVAATASLAIISRRLLRLRGSSQPAIVAPICLGVFLAVRGIYESSGLFWENSISVLGLLSWVLLGLSFSPDRTSS